MKNTVIDQDYSDREEASNFPVKGQRRATEISLADFFDARQIA